MKYAARKGVGVKRMVSLKNTGGEKREFNKSSAAHGGCLSSRRPRKIHEALCVIEFALALSSRQDLLGLETL